MKTIILNNYEEQAYVECVKEKGYYKDLNVVFSDENINLEDEVISINKKYKINYIPTLEEAINKLKLNWFIISKKEIESKTLELAIS